MGLIPLLLVCFASLTASLTCDQQTQLEQFFLGALEHNAAKVDETPGDTAAAWVRMCFHDAVTYDKKSGTGGTHACLFSTCPSGTLCERVDESNAGLGPIVDALEQLYLQNGHNNIISRADYWQLSCKVALEWTSGFTQKFRFAWGRRDCPWKNPSWPTRHPDAEHGFNDIDKHLCKRLGFTHEQGVALLGAHSLGSASRARSGYDGRWIRPVPNRLSNDYFKNLISHRWIRMTVPPLKAGGETEHQFYSPDVEKGFGLFTDIGMGWNINNGCNVTGTNTGCSINTLVAPYLMRFANDNAYWLQVFENAWWTLANMGGDKLTLNADTNYAPASYYPPAPTSSGTKPY